MYKDFSSGITDHGSVNFQSLDSNIIKAAGERIELPSDSFVRDADFSREGNDLVLKGPEGEIVIEGYFAAVPTPNLVAPNGLTLTPQLVESFTHSPLQYADANGGVASDESPIGAVSEVSGEAHVTRLDGTVEPVQLGMPIYQGDIVETDADGAVNIMFIDETSFAVSEDARLSIDEYVFDPATAEGTTNFSVLKGMFVFTSGMIGREDPDDVHIETPQGSIGIRGTIIAGDVTNGEITVVEGAIVLRDFSGNEMTLATQFETARFSPAGGQIQNMGQMSASDVAGKFASVSGVSGTLFSSINDSAGESGNQGGDTQSNNNSNASGEGESQGQSEGGNGNSTEGAQQQQQQPAQEPASQGGKQGSTTETKGSGLETGSLDGSAKGAGTSKTASGSDTAQVTSGTGSGSTAAGTNTSAGTTSTTSSSTTNTATKTGTTTATNTADTTPPPSVINNGGTTGNDGTTTGGGTTAPTTPTLPAFAWTSAGSIAENATSGTSVATLGLSATEAAQYTYSIIGGAPAGAFAIDSTGQITINNDTLIDFETATIHNLQIQVNNSAGASVGTFETSVSITDINEFAPEIDAGTPTTASVDENADIGDIVATISASDDDGSANLTYSIDAGNSDGIFAISNTGVVTIANTTLLDFETNATYTLSISVTDGDYSDTLSLSISINDIDETAIAINGNISAYEDMTYTFNTTDFDYSDPEGDAAQSVMITELPPQGTLFLDLNADNIIDSNELVALNDVINIADITAGLLKFLGDADQYGASYSQFSFAVSTDGTTFSGSATIDIALSPMNDGPEIITNTGTVVNEGGSFILTTAMIDISDPDDLAADIYYTATATNGDIYVNGVNQSNFTHQDLMSGLVEFRHGGSNNATADITFTVIDGGEDGAAGDSATFNITVTPVDDAPVSEAYGGNATEGAVTTLTTAMLDALDADTADNALTFNILGVTNGYIAYSYDTAVEITSFTREELLNGDVAFVHDGSETLNADIDFTVSDTNTTTSVVTLSLSIDEVNDQATFIEPGEINPQYFAGTTATRLFNINSGDIDDGENGLQGFQSFTLVAENIVDNNVEMLRLGDTDITISVGNYGVTLNGINFNVNISDQGAGRFEMGFDLANPGYNNLTSTELEEILNSLSYRNTAVNATQGDRTISITELVDSGDNSNGGTNSLTLSGYSSTVSVMPILDITGALHSQDGFTITDDIGLAYGAFFQGGVDIDGDGYDDLLIGRGEDTLFRLDGQTGEYNSFDVATAPAGHNIYGNDPLSGLTTGSGQIIAVGDINRDGVIDYLNTNYMANNNRGQISVWTGAHESASFDVDDAGSGEIVASYVMNNTVISIMSGGQRFISTPLDADDGIMGTSTFDNSAVPTGVVTQTYFDELNGYLVSINDDSSYGSISVYNSTNGVLVNQLTGLGHLNGAKAITVVETGGIAYAYVITASNELARFDDIYNTISGPNIINLSTLQIALDTIYSGFPAPVQPTENFDNIQKMFNDGDDVYLVVTRPSGLSSLIKMNIGSNLAGANATDISANGIEGIETAANLQLQNIQASVMQGDTLYALCLNADRVPQLIKTTLPINDPSLGLEHPTNGGEASILNSDLYPSILSAREIIVNDAGDKIAILNKYGAITEFDISAGLSNPLPLTFASSDEYVDAGITYGPNGNILISAGDQIITVNSGGSVFEIDPYASDDDMAGREAISIGDFDNDGLQDFAFSTPTTGMYGSVQIVMGNENNDYTQRIEINGIDTNYEGHIPLLNFGDLNGDGHSDIGIGEAGTNRLHIFFGNSIAAGTSFSLNDQLYKDGSYGEGYTIDLGSSAKTIMSVGSAGDFDGDGLNDILVAVKDPGASNYNVELFVVYGQAWNAGAVMNYADMNMAANAFKMHYTIPNGANADDFQMVLDTAGDLNGDGYDDIVIGTPGSDNDYGIDNDNNGYYDDDTDGTVHVIYGRDGRNKTDIEGTDYNDNLSSNANNNIIVSGGGDDIITQSNAAHTDLAMNGGSGDDRFILITDIDGMTIDGGAGFDTLSFNNTNDIDFRNITQLQTQRIEAIELTGINNTNFTLSLQNLMELMAGSDTHALRISTDGQGADSLYIDNSNAGSSGGGSITSIESALESIFGPDSVRHETDGGYENFTIGSFELQIDSNLISNTQVIDVP